MRWILSASLVALAFPADAQVATIFTPAGTFQVGGPVTVNDAGQNNSTGILQLGGPNSTTLNQIGQFNAAVVVQRGAPNAAVLNQDGAFSRARILQIGPDNTATVNQNGGSGSVQLIQLATSPLSAADLRQYAQNFLFAPESVAGQPFLARFVTQGFANTLLQRRDALRQDPCIDPTRAAYAADLTTPAASPSTQDRCPRLATFVMGDLAGRRGSSTLGGARSDAERRGITLGVEYRVSSNLVFGAGYNFGIAQTQAAPLSGAREELRSHQGALFASVNQSGWFTDAVVAFGSGKFDIERGGFLTPVTASPGASGFTAAVKGGYLFGLGDIFLGPIAGASYAKSWVDAYRENGDLLLTQSVPKRTLETANVHAGMQVRFPIASAGMNISPFLNVTIEQPLKGHQKLLMTSFLQFPDSVVLTPVRSAPERAYGKVTGGVAVQFTDTISAYASAAATSSGADERYNLAAGLNLRF